jgi:hypothetical protein
MFSHVQALLAGRRTESAAMEGSWPAVSEAWLDGDPAQRADPRFLSFLLGREVLCTTATALWERGVDVMPLGEALLQAMVEEVPWQRQVSTLDLLVPEQHYRRALDLLHERGFEAQASDPTGTLLTTHGVPFPICLRHALKGGTDSFDASALLLHGTADALLFGAPVLLPDPLDLYAYLVAQIGRARLGPSPWLKDLAELARRHRLEAHACAQRLTEYGLGRKARFVYRMLDENDRQHGTEVVACLPIDHLADVLALAVHGTRRWPTPAQRLGAVPFYLLQPDLRQGARDLLAKLADEPWYAWARRAVGGMRGPKR